MHNYLFSLVPFGADEPFRLGHLIIPEHLDPLLHSNVEVLRQERVRTPSQHEIAVDALIVYGFLHGRDMVCFELGHFCRGLDPVGRGDG